MAIADKTTPPVDLETGQRLYPCKVCGAVEDDKGEKFHQPYQVARHIMQAHKDYVAQKRAEKKGIATPGAPLTREPTLQAGGERRTVTLMSEEDRRAAIAIEGRVALNKFKREMFQEAASKTPGIAPRSIEHVLWRWDLDPNVPDNPRALWDVMVHGAGIRAEQAQMILNIVFSLEERYAEALQRAGYAPILWRSPSEDRSYGGYPYGDPYYYPRPGTVTPPPHSPTGLPPGQPPTPSVAPYGPYPPYPQPYGHMPPYQPYPPPYGPYQPPYHTEEFKGLTLKDVSDLLKKELTEKRSDERLSKLEQAVVGVGSDIERLADRVAVVQEDKSRHGDEEPPWLKDMKDRYSRLEEELKAEKEARRDDRLKTIEDRATKAEEKAAQAEKEAREIGRRPLPGETDFQTVTREIGGVVKDRRPVRDLGDVIIKVIGPEQRLPTEAEPGAESTLSRRLPREYVR